MEEKVRQLGSSQHEPYSSSVPGYGRKTPRPVGGSHATTFSTVAMRLLGPSRIECNESKRFQGHVAPFRFDRKAAGFRQSKARRRNFPIVNKGLDRGDVDEEFHPFDPILDWCRLVARFNRPGGEEHGDTSQIESKPGAVRDAHVGEEPVGPPRWREFECPVLAQRAGSPSVLAPVESGE